MLDINICDMYRVYAYIVCKSIYNAHIFKL